MASTRLVVGSEGQRCGSCTCPDLVEINLRIRACRCLRKEKKSVNACAADRICECLKRSNSQSQNILKIDFVDVHAEVPEDECGNEKKRNVLVLKLNELNVKCSNGLRHELYFPPGATAPKNISAGECLSYSVASTGDIQEHKPIPVPEEAEIRKPKEDKKCVQRQISKSMDDVKPKQEKPVKCQSTQNVGDKEKGDAAGDQSMSDMDSIELIIISDEFLNETTQNQEVIIVGEKTTKRSSSPKRSKSFQMKREFLHETKTTGTQQGDFFKRAAEAKAKAIAQSAAATAGKRLVIVSDEFKRRSQENTVRIVKSKERVGKGTQLQRPAGVGNLTKSKTISNAMVDLNSKIISCVLQSYEEPERLEDKALELREQQGLLKNKKMRRINGADRRKLNHSLTPEM